MKSENDRRYITSSPRVQAALVPGEEENQSSSSDYVPPTLSAAALPSGTVVRAPIRKFVRTYLWVWR
ncbi:hypothetical protein PF005_g21100 [Phytophthora fragariae]|uniref:Uncharacterized protein n=2 Tax=Phytophthora TaxID=4783 RepID=A0A6A3IV97_9STRA|nr:hypothetical protein PF003_g1707 [Phytophthora fragariae]KAE8966119.1 hypothetical protein PR002_g28467 [Phytophthora rubi]KAE8927782.1 hypothetical protein PF009_g22054 [Phytophthora fragariae]KAE8966314.1 hypothetical protein PR001_g28452 [Phytophthora rubi]KAE8985727.1 hypothetical protein PF011_g20271 [Phytophthora fragariae]